LSSEYTSERKYMAWKLVIGKINSLLDFFASVRYFRKRKDVKKSVADVNLLIKTLNNSKLCTQIIF